MNKISFSNKNLNNLYSNIQSLTHPERSLTNKKVKKLSKEALINVKAASDHLMTTIGGNLNNVNPLLLNKSEIEEIDTFNKEVSQLLKSADLNYLDTSSELFDRLQHLVALGCHAATMPTLNSLPLSKEAKLKEGTLRIDEAIETYTTATNVTQAIQHHTYKYGDLKAVFERVVRQIGTRLKRLYQEIQRFSAKTTVDHLTSSSCTLQKKVDVLDGKISNIVHQASSSRDSLIDAQNLTTTQINKVDKKAGLTDQLTAISNAEKNEKISDLSPRKSLQMIDKLIQEKENEANIEPSLRKWVGKLMKTFPPAKKYIKEPNKLTPLELLKVCSTQVAFEVKTPEARKKLFTILADYQERYDLKSGLIPQLKNIKASLTTVHEKKAEINALNKKKFDLLAEKEPFEKEAKEVNFELGQIQGKQAFQASLQQLKTLNEKIEDCEKASQGVTLIR